MHCVRSLPLLNAASSMPCPEKLGPSSLGVRPPQGLRIRTECDQLESSMAQGPFPALKQLFGVNGMVE